MAARFNFGGNTNFGPACRDTPPAASCCTPEPCCNPLQSQCPPKVPLRDHILIKPETAETCFLIGSDRCTAEVVHAAQHCISMCLRRRGECRVELTLRALRATLEGHACFAWPLNFWMLRDGEFEGDIYINGVLCLTVGLRMRGCDKAILSYSTTTGVPCGGAVSPQCVAPIDDGPLPTSEPCDVECSTCQ